MDDLRAALSPFDPDAQLAAAPEPWDYVAMPEVRPGPPWSTTESIAAQPALAGRIVARLMADGSAAALAAALRETASAGGQVVVTGCGTSEHAAMGVAAILRDGWKAAGLPGEGPASVQAFELSLEAPAAGLVIGISHEGGTAATLAAMEACRARGARVAAITGTADSPVGRAAEIRLVTREMDRSWCHTIGYTSPLVAATAVTGLLAGGTPNPERPRARLLDGIDAAWAAGTHGIRPAGEIGALAGSAGHLLVIASGVDRVTARELALKVEEAAYMPSATRDLETFLHGHLPATSDRTAVVFLLLERSSLETRALRMRQALRAAAVVGMRPAAILGTAASALIPADLTPGGRLVVPDQPTMPGAPAALLGAAGPLQLLTLEIAAARGTNPDPIRRDDPVYLRAAEIADTPEN